MFDRIDISKLKYFNSSCNFEKFIFEILKVMFVDKFYYWFFVWNKIGVIKSNIVYFDVIGGM